MDLFVIQRVFGRPRKTEPGKGQTTSMASMLPAAPKLQLPRLVNVRLRTFSLFSANPDASFECNKPVVCLVGANGIGKSTLLSAINFAMTGTVPDPNRSFESMEEYYRYTRRFSTNYFRGRIAVEDEDSAEIGLDFTIGGYSYHLRRNLFEPDELRGLSISKVDDPASVEDHLETPRGERNTTYQRRLVEHSGVSSFEEFVFLQHFVFTFDEQRRTLFWNSRIMDRVLYRAFGLKPDMAKRADSMWRELEQADSQVRNLQWEATRMRRRINQIVAQSRTAAQDQKNYEKLSGEHQALTGSFESLTRELEETGAALKDANLRLAEHSMREVALREEYAQAFSERLSFNPPLAQHPWVTQSLSENTCGLCGSTAPLALQTLSTRVNADHCPLCDSQLKQSSGGEAPTKDLGLLDEQLTICRQHITSELSVLSRLRSEESAAKQRWTETRDRLDEFDKENAATLLALRLRVSDSDAQVSLGGYRDQLATVERDKESAYNRREELKRTRAELQRDLFEQYAEVERSFVPAFSKLAQRFLGMPLTVQLDGAGGRDLKLVVAVRGTTRREQQELSESQRFFLDIALRMALTQHMSAAASQGGMYIDTPEGSLDIAYEKRAGEMLAMFADSGHPILMTANLNSSQLLLALARVCGDKDMKLVRMTDWAELSQVQQDEEALFDEAYRQIESAMTH